MSFPTISVFQDLLSAHSSWESLSAYLRGPECLLRITETASAVEPYAVIRYVKGQSNFANPLIRAFRSVVWDTLENRPVCATSWKSADGESVPETPFRSADGTANFTLEHFPDGTLIGMFWDKYSASWRIHTRSVLNARSRFYSQTKTFAQMFDEARVDHSALDKTRCYTWVLQHPENRIVCATPVPKALLVDSATIGADNSLAWHPSTQSLPTTGLADWDAVRARVGEWNGRFRHNCQGLVIKAADGRRWKLRCEEYNATHALRGNSPRLDFLYLSRWQADTLNTYLAVYPEERRAANAIIAQWKTVTTEVYHIYCDVFKARTLPKTNIPPKYRPLIYGLHGLYLETLKPAGKTVDWKACLEWMNGRDTPQMLFVINWEFRMAARATGHHAAEIPVEPPAASTTVGASEEVVAAAEATVE